MQINIRERKLRRDLMLNLKRVDEGRPCIPLGRTRMNHSISGNRILQRTDLTTFPDGLTSDSVELEERSRCKRAARSPRFIPPILPSP